MARFQQRGRPAFRRRLPPDAVENVTRLLTGSADSSYGGFGHGAKFPQADAVELLLTVGEVDLARRALDGMLKLEDPIEGGFYRYATQPDWSHPHYEKMLAVQAELIPRSMSKAAADPALSGPAAHPAPPNMCRQKLSSTKRPATSGASQDADENYYTVERKRRAPIDRTLSVPIARRR